MTGEASASASSAGIGSVRTRRFARTPETLAVEPDAFGTGQADLARCPVAPTASAVPHWPEAMALRRAEAALFCALRYVWSVYSKCLMSGGLDRWGFSLPRNWST